MRFNTEKFIAERCTLPAVNRTEFISVQKKEITGEDLDRLSDDLRKMAPWEGLSILYEYLRRVTDIDEQITENVHSHPDDIKTTERLILNEMLRYRKYFDQEPDVNKIIAFADNLHTAKLMEAGLLKNVHMNV